MTVKFAQGMLIGLCVLIIVGTGVMLYKLLSPVDYRPAPSGNCDLWIKDSTPTFVCVDQGEATVWRLHRNGRWQYIGPATNSNLGVNQG